MARDADDRVSVSLAARGYDIQWCAPAEGEALPRPAHSHSLAVVYGGVQSANSGAENPYIDDQIDWIRDRVNAGRPLLGLCLGGQLLARAFGAKVGPHAEGRHEIGYTCVQPVNAAHDFLAEPTLMYQCHGEGFEVPAGAELLATGDTFANQAFRYGAKAYGLQFHPDATPTIIETWMTDFDLGRKGAHSLERQRADARRFDGPMDDWFEGFVDYWLADD